MNKYIVVISAALAAAVLYSSGVFDTEEPASAASGIQTSMLAAETIKPLTIAPLKPQTIMAEVSAPREELRAISGQAVAEQIIAAPADLNNSDITASQAIVAMALALGPRMTSDEIIRKWVVAIDNLASGDLISKHQPWVFKMESFTVTGDNMRLSPENYPRAQPLVDAALAIPPQKLARYYQNWLPLFEQAYAELGKADSFADRLSELLKRIDRIQPLAEIPELERKSVMYTYKNIALEEASDLEKLMWRLGPDNSQRLQDFARQLQTVL